MSVEHSVYVKDGKIYLTTENDGATFLRRGAERRERIVTLDELKSFPKQYAEALQMLEEEKNKAAHP